MTTTQTPADKRFLSPSEAAEELGVSKSSIYRACEEGALSHVQLRPGGALRIPVDALQPHSTSSGETTATGGHEEPHTAAKSPAGVDHKEGR